MALTIVVAATTLLVGCGQSYNSNRRLENGLVIVLPGIEGRGSGLAGAIADGLDKGGVDWAIEIEDWTSPLGPLYNLRAEERNRRQARKIARHVQWYRQTYPGKPVVLVGQSGGGGIAIWTAEALGHGNAVDGLILLAASISPGYELDTALANSKRGIVNVYSSGDWVLLGVGTTVAGTMDGQHTSSAGRTGFVQPEDGERGALYEKLYEFAWVPQMSRDGHSGGHLSSGAKGFVSTYIAPLVRSDRWNSQILQRVMTRKGLCEDSGKTPDPEWKPMYLYKPKKQDDAAGRE